MDYPQWLLPTYIRSARTAGATVSDQEITAACQRLIEMWAAPSRHHHNLHHLCDMLSRVTTLAPETHNPDLVKLAAYYHGCVFSTAEKDTYTRNGGENEVESARVAQTELAGLGIPEKKVDRVAELIIGVKKQPKEAEPTTTATLNTMDIDKLALRDAHLGSLAAGPQKYTKYLEAVQQEYEHIPALDFLLARQKIIGKLLSRKQLFLSPLGRQWEAPARQNLTAELERIEVKLAKLGDATIPSESEPPAEWEHPRESEDGTPESGNTMTPEEYAEQREQTPTPALEKLSDLEAEPAPSHDPLLRPLSQDAIVKPDDRSSLENLPDDAEPGPAPRELSPAEKKKAERDEIARQMQERLVRRQQCEAMGKEPKQEAPDLAPVPHHIKHSTPRTAESPHWEEDDGSGRAGFEREPKY
ncbi:MAG: hypothetical protein QMB98_02310 [Flaviflexus sp.]|uniref:HD domain-containing protein n=1 Tax=Flaviflexus sp. TaxID=1969482 RepID=UPI00352E78BF